MITFLDTSRQIADESAAADADADQWKIFRATGSTGGGILRLFWDKRIDQSRKRGNPGRDRKIDKYSWYPHQRLKIERLQELESAGGWLPT